VTASEKATGFLELPLQTALRDPTACLSETVVDEISADRFRGNKPGEKQHLLALKPWTGDPTEQGFQGGNLYGMSDAIGHLKRWESPACTAQRSSAQPQKSGTSPLTAFRPKPKKREKWHSKR